MKTCEHCESPYQCRASRQRFCDRCIDRKTICEACGTTIVSPRRLKPRRFCNHSCWARFYVQPKCGADNPRFNGGLCFHAARNRWIIHCRDHTLMPYARAVMAAHVGRLLDSEEIVHHVNGDSSDDRIENLQIVTRAEHMRIHASEIYAARWAA